MNNLYANQFSPVGYAGMLNGAPQGFLDKPFLYTFDITLAGSATAINQQIPIQTDSTFLLRGVYISFATGLFSFRFSDPNGYFFSDSLLSSLNFSTFAGQPFVIVPEVIYPAGSKLSIDIQDTSGASNTIEIVFMGVKRFLGGK